MHHAQCTVYETGSDLARRPQLHCLFLHIPRRSSMIILLAWVFFPASDLFAPLITAYEGINKFGFYIGLVVESWPNAAHAASIKIANSFMVNCG